MALATAPLTKIQCPSCGASIQITDAIAREFATEAEAKVRQLLADQKKDLIAREQAIRYRETLVQDAEGLLEERVCERLAAASATAENRAKAVARAELEVELQDLRNALSERDRLAREARDTELRLRQEKRALEEHKETMTLELTRALDAERAALIESTVRRTQEEYRLRDAEKERKLQEALRVNDELRRKLEQGSQQTQGEALETTLEASLRVSFPGDVVEPVPKGVRGADLIQRVHSRSGQFAGTVLWEFKNTKNWSDGWIDKIREDQRVAKADIAIIVSRVLPPDIDGCGVYDGVWLAEPRLAVGLATALRSGMLEVTLAKRVVAGKTGALEVLFNYLTGPEFRQHVEAQLRAFIEMQSDLAEEKRHTARRRAKREKQINRVIESAGSVYGDLQGLIGAPMPRIAALDEAVDSSDVSGGHPG